MNSNPEETRRVEATEQRVGAQLLGSHAVPLHTLFRFKRTGGVYVNTERGIRRVGEKPPTKKHRRRKRATIEPAATPE